MINISVITPVYNAEQHIEGCIESLFSQNYPRENYEIIMVNNCSTDASADIIKRYPFITLLSESKRCSYVARNRGLAKARGSIIAFTDADCVPSSDWLQNIATAMVSSDTRVVIGCPQPAFDSPLLSMIAAYENAKDSYVFNSNIKELYYGYAGNMAARRELFEELGPFLEIPRGSDTIFVRRVTEKYSCDTIRYCPDVRVRHMELDTLLSYYQKMFIYGCSRRIYGQVPYTRPLNYRERILAFRSAIRTRNYPPAKSIPLLFLLIVWGGLLGFRRLDRHMDF